MTFRVLREWPKVSRNVADIDTLKPVPYLGGDIEWNITDGIPTIIGVSDGTTTVSAPYAEAKPYVQSLVQRWPQARWVLHNGLTSDIPILDADGVHIPVANVDDTILWHWLTGQSLCKAAKKFDDDEGERRGRGFMNIYAFTMQYTDLPYWKGCLKDACVDDRPCPEHTPYLYNGLDSLGPVLAMPGVMQRARMLGVDKLYPLHRDVSVVLAEMRDRGVLIDVSYVDMLRGQFETGRAELRTGFTFNPDSPKQVVSHFAAKGIKLVTAEEQTVRDAVEESDDDELATLLEYKELGKGPDRWFAPKEYSYDKQRWKGYVDAQGFIHCNLNFFTSTGRFACSNPNLQNVSKRRKDRKTGESLGKRVRRAICAPDGYYLYRADWKNAENRVFLHLAGHTSIPDIDFHAHMRDSIGIKETDPFAIALGGAREAAKSVTHATDYLEGLQLIERSQLRTPRIMNEVAKGARLIFPDWIVFGKVVTFTGVNLSKRAFGEASYENRKRALDIQNAYFAGFPGIRKLQQRITTQIEQERCVRPPTGYVLLSYGPEHDRLKTGASMYGQNPVAHLSKYSLLNAANHPHITPILQVHDELLMYVDRRHDPTLVGTWIRECMEIELPDGSIPGLRVPVDCSYGENWSDQHEIAQSTKVVFCA